jgi:APA family basic amino acid/polyamine antiporter
LIILAILAGYSSVILVMLLGQSRIFYSMSRDGLMPKVFSEVHPKYRSTFKSNLLFLLLVSAFALFVPAHIAGELTSIGTLLAFIIVCIGILVMRKKQPDAPRGFRTPGVPVVPVLGIAICLFMMVFLPFDTWIRLILWMLVGHNIYVFYGSRKSHLGSKKGVKLLYIIGFCISAFLLTLASIHQWVTGWKDISTFTIVLLFIALLHIVFYGIQIIKRK